MAETFVMVVPCIRVAGSSGDWLPEPGRAARFCQARVAGALGQARDRTGV